jgi:hypothetical protein
MDIINEKPVDLTFEEFCQGGKSITPGPWEVSQAIRQWYTVYSKDGFIVGCEDEEGRYGAVRCAADARLIAAAPELLEALRKALPAIVQCERAYRNIGAAVGQGEFQRALDAALAAIAKAEGKNT